MKFIYISILISFLWSQNLIGGVTGAALDLSANAYEKSLSYSGVALGDDIGGISYNPAVAANIDSISGTFTHLNYIEDIEMFYGNFFYPKSKFSFTGRFGYMYMPSVTDYQTGKELKYREFFIGGGSGYKYNRNISIGANINLYTATFAESSGITFFLNTGINYETYLPLLNTHKIVIGASILNLGPGIKFKQQRSSLPLSFNLGAKYVYEYDYRLFCGLRKLADNDNLSWSIAGELVMFKFFSARLSAYTDPNNNLKFNMGAGFKITYKEYDFIIDYTSLPLEEIEYSNIITFTFRFPAKKGKQMKQEKWENIWKR